MVPPAPADQPDPAESRGPGGVPTVTPGSLIPSTVCREQSPLPFCTPFPGGP